MTQSSRGRDIVERTFGFAVQIVRLCRTLRSQPSADHVLVRQLLRSGTSVGANVEEAQAAETEL